MSSETPDAEPVGSEELSAAENAEVGPRLVVQAMAAGAVGLVSMLPFLVGIPAFLGQFRTGPLTNFANIGSLFGLVDLSSFGTLLGFEPAVVVGGLLFVFGGVVFLPIQFLIVATFLPPSNPRRYRGLTFSMLWCAGFIGAFLPGGGVGVVALFVAVAVLGHLTYGLVLGTLLDRYAEIPEHAV